MHLRQARRQPSILGQLASPCTVQSTVRVEGFCSAGGASGSASCLPAGVVQQHFGSTMLLSWAPSEQPLMPAAVGQDQREVGRQDSWMSRTAPGRLWLRREGNPLFLGAAYSSSSSSPFHTRLWDNHLKTSNLMIGVNCLSLFLPTNVVCCPVLS